MSVTVQEQAFDPGAELSRFSATQNGAGAVVSFTGVVRDVAGGLRYMEIEHYPAMTTAAIEAHVAEAMKRWSLSGAKVIHRFGQLSVDEPIMMVCTAAPHRKAAFEAADFLMDYLKSRAPFWKKEVTETGEAWVEATSEDEAALDRWK